LAKVILVLLILLGAALYFPKTRPVVLEFVGPVVNPVLRWQTDGEMERIARELESLHRQGSNIPTPGASFQSWMERNFMGGAKEDAWGNNYSLKVWRESVGIVSSGPDEELDTADDLVFPLSFRMERSRN
jgi:hypothetical protein